MIDFIMDKLAACILITKEENDKTYVLGVTRKNNEQDFGLPGGKVENDETPVLAAKRELREETGLDANVFHSVFSDSDGEYVVTTYSVKHYYGIPGTMEKGTNVAWVEPKKLIEGSFSEYNKKLFDKLSIKY